MSAALRTATFDYRAYVGDELARRRGANPRYSLRGFAKTLGLDAGYLSKVLSGQMPLSLGAAKKVVAALKMSDAEAQLLIEAIADGARERHDRVAAPRERAPVSRQEVDADAYAVIADMHHYAILEATYLPDFEPDARWVARRFGITKLEAEYALARLVRLGLLGYVDGVLKKTSRFVTTKDKSYSTPALRQSQRQILKSAMKALDHDPIERRSANGMTMAIDPAKLPLAKQMIRDFMAHLCEVVEAGEQKEVYQLSVQFFSLEQNLVPST